MYFLDTKIQVNTKTETYNEIITFFGETFGTYLIITTILIFFNKFSQSKVILIESNSNRDVGH